MKEFRCYLCNKLLFKTKNLRISEGYIEIKCRCKAINTLSLDTPNL